MDPKLKALYHKAHEYKEYGLRKGQSFFNALYDVDPDLADKIRDTEIDPFYTDDKLNEFLETVINTWENNK